MNYSVIMDAFALLAFSNVNYQCLSIGNILFLALTYICFTGITFGEKNITQHIPSAACQSARVFWGVICHQVDAKITEKSHFRIV